MDKAGRTEGNGGDDGAIARESGAQAERGVLIIVSRVVLALLGGLGAYQAGASLPLDEWFSSPWRYAAWAAITVVGALAGLLLGGLFGRLLRFMRFHLSRFPLHGIEVRPHRAIVAGQEFDLQATGFLLQGLVGTGLTSLAFQ